MSNALEIIDHGYRSQDGTYGVGDLVTRNGTDVHKVISLEPDGFAGEFLCVVEPRLRGDQEKPWIALGETEYNLCRRYSLVEESVADGEAACSEGTPFDAKAAEQEFLAGMHEMLAWPHDLFQAQRRQIQAAFDHAKPALVEMMAALNDVLPKPQTPRDRVRALKAHPKSVRGRA